ncbi:MAG: 8-amino-7-oxononanoate synthase [Acidobacteriota bacterium]
MSGAVATGGLEGRIAADRAVREADGLVRRLARPAGIDFSSNDYLGLAGDFAFAAEVAARIAASAAAGAPLFAPASRLLRGHLEAHERIEARLAAFKGSEAALILPSGWQANAALAGGLFEPGDVVISDALNHASLIDALRAARVERRIVPHLDLDAVRRELGRPRREGETFVLVESLYSMDGDLAPLGELAALCSAGGCHLLVDEAHATGLYGEARGSGWIEACGAESGVLASVTTFGKALALQGGAVCGPRFLIDRLVQRARALVFSTAVSPLLILALEVALDRVLRDPGRRGRLHVNARRLRGALADGGLEVARQGSPIVPVLIGDNARSVEIAQRLARRGFDVRAVRPPTVPEGTARLRLSVHADHAGGDLDALAAAVAEEMGR